MEIPLFDHTNAFLILFSYFLVKHEVEYLYLIAVYPKLPLRAIYAPQWNEVSNIMYAWDKRHEVRTMAHFFPTTPEEKKGNIVYPCSSFSQANCGSCYAQQA